MDNTTKLPNPGTVLAFGIVGLATCFSGILGIIFSALAVAKAKKFRKFSVERSGQVNTGYGLGIAGLVISCLVIVTYIVLIILAVANGGNFNFYYGWTV